MEEERDRLVALLRHKLTELDASVVAYRRDCADDFRRFAAEVLQPAPKEVAAVVAREFDSPDGVRATRETYTALYPGLVDGHDVDAEGNNCVPLSILTAPPPSRAQRPTSPPPILYHTSGVPKDGPRRPLAATPTLASALSSPTIGPVNELPPSAQTPRDNELGGVFTPPFLPLLDSSSATRWTDEGQDAAGPTADKGKDSKGTEDSSQQTDAEEPALPSPSPPKPKLKSALRKPTVRFPSRSSTRMPTPSASDGSSPEAKRRVRFSFDDGEEVLPTESPPEAVRNDDDSNTMLWVLPDDPRINRNNNNFTMPLRALPSWAAPDDSRIDRSFYGYSTQVPADETLLAPAAAIPIASMNSDSATGPVADQGSGSAATPTLLPGEDMAIGDLATESAAVYKDDKKDGAVGADDRDENELLPLSRKVSSSDRLRALSKIPLEDPTMWTVVNPEADSGDNTDMDPAEAPSVNSLSQNTAHALRPSWRGDAPTVAKVVTNADEDDAEDEEEEEDDDDSDFVAMKSSQRHHSIVPPLSPKAAVPVSPSLTTSSGFVLEPFTPKEGSVGKPKDNVVVETVPAEDDLFEFEQDDADGAAAGDDIGYPLARVAASPRVEPTADLEDDADVDQDVLDEVSKEKDLMGLDDDADADNNGAALAIHHARKPSDTTTDVNNGNGNGNGNGVSIRRESGPLPGSLVGSYRGRPLSMFGVVKDPRILEQAAAMGDVSSFVGSIDGRTGVDDDVTGAGSLSRSGRDGITAMQLLSGTPRSLTERMAMEEARAQLAAARSPRT